LTKSTSRSKRGIFDRITACQPDAASMSEKSGGFTGRNSENYRIATVSVDLYRKPEFTKFLKPDL
jgi:hypothetical protein